GARRALPVRRGPRRRARRVAPRGRPAACVLPRADGGVRPSRRRAVVPRHVALLARARAPDVAVGGGARAPLRAVPRPPAAVVLPAPRARRALAVAARAPPPAHAASHRRDGARRPRHRVRPLAVAVARHVAAARRLRRLPPPPRPLQLRVPGQELEPPALSLPPTPRHPRH